ncbi:rhodanese-like domain-containing protein [Bifidobacterium oedipodis]|uniref:Sulfurtransferase n=1 Tax=Bifidobacterium oedipodis TaxID=2675322 RepID=A0A7Y0HSG6_9BIFI|nr:rhodanese-like domain-containing protein [Bifidobacterium sp. DSM 109957]NMM93573.1 sulfurtransferase [Bifidobacterium sp. DSM 109957]
MSINDSTFRHITPAEFDRLDHSAITLLDLRDPAEVAAHPVPDAINAPIDPLAQVLRSVPNDKPVVVFCTEGWWSAEVAEILTDRGYDVASLDGGYRAYQTFLNASEQGNRMANRS